MAIEKNKRYYTDRLAELKGFYQSSGADQVDEQKSRYLYPHGRNNDDPNADSDAERKDFYILNNTVLSAIRTAVAGIFSGSTPPLEPWFRLKSEDADLNEIESVKTFFQESTDILLQDMAKSNFYSIIELAYKDILTFSISNINVDEDTERVFNFSHVPNGQYYIDVDGRGEVSAVYREFRMRARNVIEEYGIEKVSDKVRAMVEGNKTGSAYVNLLHVIEKNQGRDVTKEDNINMPWSSITHELTRKRDDQAPLRESGYITKPFAVPRWSVSSGNIYGDGPGDMALGDAKQLQTLMEKLLLAVEKEIDPPVVTEAGTIVNTGPNEITEIDDFSSKQGRKVERLYETNIDISKLVALIIDTQQRIRDAFFANLFFSQGEADPRETATLTIAKQRELLRLLGPVIQRLEPELFRPIIQRCFDIEFRLGRLPEIPEELEGREIKIEIISSLTKAQELSTVTPIQEMMAIVANMAQLSPDALKKFDVKQAIDEISNAFGIPAGIIRTDEVVEELEAIEAQRQLEQQQLAEAQAAIEGVEKLSKTDLSGDNALNALLQQGSV